MSHLAKIIALKSTLLDQGITCPIEQSKVIESVFVKSCISFIFRTSNNLADPNNASADCVKAQLHRWNEVSPLNGQLIMNTVAAAIRIHHAEGCAGGEFTPVCYYYPDNLKDKATVDECITALFGLLVKELCTEDI